MCRFKAIAFLHLIIACSGGRLERFELGFFCQLWEGRSILFQYFASFLKLVPWFVLPIEQVRGCVDKLFVYRVDADGGSEDP